ncbi:RICIN domain-containing protein [Kitasatospora viridis]|uniref:Ricin-type beta-trefoil lectin protein n=1 Tax=Kitasatospora viridis TaxID=281105 RepID=A0A561SDN9_9ACTN|nr:RICIN domain-containing protein [Kitasatospora viridis]TWF72977.1 ricin-type beta-trefoil lectin protein [Kitasatospora viridis]
MSTPRQRLGGALAALALAVTGPVLATPANAATPAAAPAFSVTVGSSGSYAYPDDTPAFPFTDKDGSFHVQESDSLYGATDPRQWSFYTGSNFDTATPDNALDNAVNPANSNDRNNDTTWRCDNSPTGLSATNAPAGSGYAQRNYCDLSSVWVDPDTGDWYGLVHNEFTPQPFGDGIHFDAIDYAKSTDQGRTWTIEDHVITSPYSTTRGDANAFPQQTYYYGDGDQRLFVDTASGYFYVFYGSRIVDKNGSWGDFLSHVARAPISGKMAPGTWQKWYDGAWSQPGVGGQESDLVPADAANPNGYLAPSAEYNPANPGTVSQQLSAGTLQPTSPLFVMNITYDAYLGLYLGTPQAVDQSGNAPQQVYATSDLASEKWTLLGDTGSYHTASWYRWFLDSANRTGTGIVGKQFRLYCAYGCSNGSSGEYANLTVDAASPAPAPFDPAKTYQIGSGGQLLTQAGKRAAAAKAASTSAAWSFSAVGDGSYLITNAASGGHLGVDASGNAGRAWGAATTVTTATGVGQQWFVIPAGGSYRLVNRYSGLVLALNGSASETTPLRTWTDTTGSAVGGGRTAAQQTLAITAVGGTGGGSITGAHPLTAAGKALDDPNHSTTAGTQLITWTPNGGANQSWQFAQQADGSYQLTNAQSGLCADVSGGSTAAGAQVIQWSCTGAANQHWRLSRNADGSYTVSSVRSGLLLTTASGNDGALVTQQADSGSASQHWTIG